MAPDWLESLAKAYIALAFLCSAVIAVDLWRHPQKMWIMNAVWPVTALYWGPVALWSYKAMGRPKAKGPRQGAHGSSGGHEGRQEPFWRTTAVGVTHCGAGCTLGDIGGEWLVFGAGWTVLGKAIYAAYLVDFGFAYVLGIVFQYFSIAPMRGLGLKDGIVAALKADTVSLIAFEVGLFAWMAVAHFLLFPQETVASWNHWFMMQIGMIVGFFTSYPANWFLIRKGLKEAM